MLRTLRQHLQLLIAIALLLDEDSANLHGRLRPSGIPAVASLPEVLLGIVAPIQPWLATLAILEPTVGSADGDVEDQVKLLVKWRIVSAGL